MYRKTLRNSLQWWMPSASWRAHLLAVSMILAVIGTALTPTSRALAGNVMVVDSTGDEPDADPLDPSCKTALNTCTLRAAIGQANVTPGPDDIAFSPSLNTATIQLLDVLPPLYSGGAGGITIHGERRITLDGTSLGPHTPGVPSPLPVGLDLRAPSNKIQGLTLMNFGTGVLIEVAGDNVVGTDGDGGVSDSSEGNVFKANDIAIEIERNPITQPNRISGNVITSSGLAGVRLEAAVGNIIGTNGDGISDSLERNVISGNLGDGILVGGSQNRIAGNYIGVDTSGRIRLANSGNGIKIVGSQNIVGTNGDLNYDDQERNVISGNLGDGILIDSGTQNQISGNYIGVDASGGALVGNGGNGVRVVGSSAYPTNNTIGTNSNQVADADERNVISGNNGDGILVDHSHYNRIAGNYIGVDASGRIRLDNAGNGIRLVNGSFSNIIGTNGDGTSDNYERNVISGNRGDGILIDASYDITIGGNYIGVDASGSAAVPNVANGVEIVNTPRGVVSHNVIGVDISAGGVPGGINIISGNGGSGIRLVGASNNFIAGNYIGVDFTGSIALGNHGGGIRLESGSDHNQIGTSASPSFPVTVAQRNVISGNYSHGVYIEASDFNGVSGNYIGTDKNGSIPLPNQGNGVWLLTTATNFIGVPEESQGGEPDPQNGNIIAFNAGDGVRVDTKGFVATDIGIPILDNTIFSNGSLGIDLAYFTDLPSGVTPNDPGDADSGPNGLVNYPRLILIGNSGSTVSIYGGIFNGLPGRTFRIQFFANQTCDPSGFGEGQIFLGETTVATTSSIQSVYPPGQAIFNVTFAKAIPPNYLFTSTATLFAESTAGWGSTSEFSPCTPIVKLIKLGPPAKPISPFGPTNNASPAFSWSAVEGARRYNLVVKGSAGTVVDTWFEAGDSSETSICRKIGACTVQLDAPLQEGKYEWRVRAADDVSVGPFGQVVSFNVDLTPPLAPALASPPDGSTVSIKKLRLNWDKVTDADTYHLQMAADPDFAYVAVDLTTQKTEFNPDVNQKLSLDHTYYWRVQARDAAGNWSAWSALQTVTVVTSNPAETGGLSTPTPTATDTPTPTNTGLPTIRPQESTGTPAPGETPTP